MRNLRHFPPGSLVEVTTRTQGRRLMVPSRLLNQIIVGVLGRAQGRYPVRIHAYGSASNHYHLTLTVDDARHSPSSWATSTPSSAARSGA